MVIKKGGKKGKKTKNNQQSQEVRPLPVKELDQEYCQVNKLLGNCRLEGNCFDGKALRNRSLIMGFACP